LGYVKAGGASVDRQYNFLLGGGTIATLDERRGGWSIGIGGEQRIDKTDLPSSTKAGSKSRTAAHP